VVVVVGEFACSMYRLHRGDAGAESDDDLLTVSEFQTHEQLDEDEDAPAKGLTRKQRKAKLTRVCRSCWVVA